MSSTPAFLSASAYLAFLLLLALSLRIFPLGPLGFAMMFEMILQVAKNPDLSVIKISDQSGCCTQ